MTAIGCIIMTTWRCSLPEEKAERPELAAGEVRRPLLWLTLILGLGLFLRCWYITNPLQLDEFGPLYAIAERETATAELLPASSDPLVPVAGWEEVRSRSILPYGIVNSVPVYHYLLYGLIH